MCLKGYFLFLITTLCIINVKAAGRIDTIKRCCTIGNDRANSGLSCTVSTPVKDVESIYQEICTNTIEKCCNTNNKELKCLAGQDDAKEGKVCADIEDNAQKECCDACAIGLEAKAIGDDCDATLGFDPLFDKTITKCCNEATKPSTTPSTTIKPITERPTTIRTTIQTTKSTKSSDTPKKTTPYRTTLKNMCGISDTCAQVCIPEGNTFKCDCRKGYTLMKDGVSCKPSRLNAKPNRCKPNPCGQKCTDTGTSIVCSCYEGYELDEDKRSCSDIDECERDIYTCEKNETCINYQGSYECYDPDKPLIDDIEDKYETCPDGYIFDAELKLCDDIDECEVGLVCARPQVCTNTIGSYKCEGDTTIKCPPGFDFSDDTQECEDIDECLTGTDDCNRKSQNCLNTKGNFTCVDKASKMNCPPGFKMDTNSDECVDINECEENEEICGENEKCVNEAGRYACQPLPKATPTKPKTELPTTKPISENPSTKPKTEIPSTKTNLENPSTKPETDVPTIKPRTEVSSTTTEVPTLKTRTVKTTAKSTTRKTPDISPTSDNEISSFVPPISKPTIYPAYKTSIGKRPSTNPSVDIPKNKLSCQRGFTLLSNKCVDVDECIIDEICDSNQECLNTMGSYNCICKSGFTKDFQTGACIDVNECQIGAHDCIDGQRCDNTIGSYLCSRTAGCGTGYTLNYQKGYCEDDDECQLNTHHCKDLGTDFVCRNTLGSYRCERERHSIFPHITQKPDIPNLYNIINGQLKRCLPGYRRNAQGDCEDIDECESSPCPRGMKCVNANGKFHCISGIQCIKGKELNEQGTGCIDVNECERGIHQCKTGQICENHDGFYVCKCPSGHKLNTNMECEDIDECQMFKGRVCYTNAYCRNTVGSYTCECKDGFYKNGVNCEDTDECSETNLLCEQKCVNLWGSYRCSCGQGYTLNPDNRTCSDINECDKFKDRYLCVGSCENIPGSYACTCPSGYKLGSDGRTCQDIDECTLTGCPDPSNVCVNTRGGHRCQRIICPPNYIRDPEYKSQCKKGPNVCDPRHLTCRDMPEQISYFFVSFVSNLYIAKPIEFLHLRTPDRVDNYHTLRIVSRRCRPDIHCVSDSHFKLIRKPSGANLAIVRSIEGPQDIELELESKISFGYISTVRISKIFLFVSEYSF